MEVQAKKWPAHGAMIVSTLLVATSFPAVAKVAGVLESSVLVLLRFALASLLFLPLVTWRHGREVLPEGRSLIRYAILSAPLIGFFLAMFEALRTTSAVNSAALFTFAPGFAAFFSFLLERERLAPRRLVALVLGMVGALWVVLGGGATTSMTFAPGDGIFLAGTALLGLYSVLVKRLHRGEPMAVMTFWTLVTGSGWLLLLGGGKLAAVRWSALDPEVVAVVMYLALFTTLFTFLLTQRATAVIGATRSMAYGYLNPALVAVLAGLAGNAPLHAWMLPGLVLTLGAMVELQRDGSWGTGSGIASGSVNSKAVAVRVDQLGSSMTSR